MIESMYYVKCDCCPAYYPEAEGASSRQEAEEIARQIGWLRIGSIDLCPSCVNEIKLPKKKKKRGEA